MMVTESNLLPNVRWRVSGVRFNIIIKIYIHEMLRVINIHYRYCVVCVNIRFIERRFYRVEQGVLQFQDHNTVFKFI